MRNEATTVFVSYSHADASLVAPVVKLLRVNNSFVFQDIDRIRPGKKWRSEIAKALNEAQLVVVFWCSHASQSIEVSNEWKAAIEQEKDVLPLLLDETPLPPELGDFQWIDFRVTVGGSHGSIAAPAPERTVRMKYNWFPILGFATIMVAAVGVSLFTMHSSKDTPTLSIDLPVDGLPPPPTVEIASRSSIFLVVSVVIAIIACLVLVWRWRSGRRAVTKGTYERTGNIERRIATELEAELLRRTRVNQDGAQFNRV